MFNGLITVGAVDTLCWVFFLDAMYVGVQGCKMCSEAKYSSLICFVWLFGRVCMVWSLLGW